MPEPENPETPPEPRVKTGKIDAVRQLVQMMKDNELTAIDFIDGSTQIRLRRQGFVTSAPISHGFAPPPLVPAPIAHPAPTAATPAPSSEPVAPAPASGVVIESPMVGTYYSSSSPDAPSFVAVGSTIRADTTVCIIEAMKVFTDIPAGVAGTITEILVKNGQSVEFGQPLFRINPA